MKCLFIYKTIICIVLFNVSAYAETASNYSCRYSDLSQPGTSASKKKDIKILKDGAPYVIFTSDKYEVQIDRQETKPKGLKKMIGISIYQKGKPGGLSALTEEGNPLTLTTYDYNISVFCDSQK